MHSVQRSRGKVLFEVFCALGLAASLAGAWDQTGSSALLASAAITALFAFYWSFGLVARDRRDDVAQPTVAEAAQPIAAVADAREAAVETAVPEEVFFREPEVVTEPEPVAAEPKKRRARKAPKATAVAAALVEPAEPEAIEQPVSSGPPLEQLFDVQPLVRQPRPAFGRKARGNRPIPAA